MWFGWLLYSTIFGKSACGGMNEGRGGESIPILDIINRGMIDIFVLHGYQWIRFSSQSGTKKMIASELIGPSNRRWRVVANLKGIYTM